MYSNKTIIHKRTAQSILNQVIKANELRLAQQLLPELYNEYIQTKMKLLRIRQQIHQRLNSIAKRQTLQALKSKSKNK